MRLKCLLLLSLVGLCFTLQAQDYKIVDVKYLPSDMSAREDIKTDANGRKCALFKIATRNISPEMRERFFFEPDLGSYVVERIIKDGEILLWVSPGIKTLIVKHHPLGSYELHMNNYGIKVESLNTYKVVIQGTSVRNNNEVNQQYLAFQITPSQATLEVDGKIWDVASDGTAMKFVNFGTYNYKVQYPGYHSEEGTVIVDDPENTQKVIVRLKSNLGWIEVRGNGSLTGANVYIDNVLVGKAPCKSNALVSGRHSVRITKSMYEDYVEDVIVKDNEITIMSPVLGSDFAEVTIKVDADAEIWINDVMKGTRSWTGPLSSGIYKVECKMIDHEPSLTSVEINSNMNGQTISVAAPRPICGSLNVESMPNFAIVYLDGKAIGETPKFVSEVMIGEHELKLVKDGYNDYSQKIVIQKGQRTQVQAKLDQGVDVRFACSPSEAQLSIDGKPMTSANNTYRLSLGTHRIKVSANGYHDYVEDINFSNQNNEATIRLNRIWAKETFVTINGAYSPVSLGFSVGQVKHFGWFVSLMSNADFIGFSASGNCDAQGFLDDGSLPVYSGEVASGRHSIIVGGMMRLVGPLCARVGVGYGMRYTCWRTIVGDYYRVNGYSWQGVDVSAGLQLNVKRFVVSAEAVTTNFQTIEGKLGLGMSF